MYRPRPAIHAPHTNHTCVKPPSTAKKKGHERIGVLQLHRDTEEPRERKQAPLRVSWVSAPELPVATLHAVHGHKERQRRRTQAEWQQARPRDGESRDDERERERELLPESLLLQ